MKNFLKTLADITAIVLIYGMALFAIFGVCTLLFIPVWLAYTSNYILVSALLLIFYALSANVIYWSQPNRPK